MEDKTAYGANGKVTGTMPNNGALSYTPSTSAQTIPAGYTSGGTISGVTSAIDNNIQAENIKKDITILGVTGTLEDSREETILDVSDIIGSESSEGLIERVMQGIISSGIHYRTEKKMSSWKALIRSVGYNRSNGTMPVKINDEIFTSEKLKDAIWDMVERA